MRLYSRANHDHCLREVFMAKRFILNETSYHGHGAVNEIVPEVKSRGFKKALIVTDADLVKFQVVKKAVSYTHLRAHET